ncbi:putative xyloglucan endotransglucosylase/hydrolase protein 10 isoform X2 [Capsicum galapagoense]
MKNFSKLILFVTIFNYLSHIILASIVSTGDFNKDFYVNYSPNHVNTSADGRTRSLIFDKESGTEIASNDMYLFGQFDMKIKLISGNSAGTVVAFYLASGQPNHDEVDFEFLGNVAGKPFTLQTNVYVDGSDDREERISLWFDPTQDFHTYSILWNLHQIVFMVDWVPIRTYRNHADKGAKYPRWQPMELKISIWNGETWATDGGKTKIDWSQAPFVATLGNYSIDACNWKGNARFCRVVSENNWWNKGYSSTLTWTQRRLFKWVRKYHLTYDYCMDNQRFQNNIPIECSLPKY